MDDYAKSVLKQNISLAEDIIDDIKVIPSHETDGRLLGIMLVAGMIVTSLTALLEK